MPAICRTCQQKKLLSEFYSRSDTGKRHTQCKDCYKFQIKLIRNGMPKSIAKAKTAKYDKPI